MVAYELVIGKHPVNPLAHETGRTDSEMDESY
jgi:hypothetical protein